MNTSPSTLTSISESEILITRQINAPREVVFRAWTDAEQVAHWWGPHNFSLTTSQMEVRPGGVWRFVMHGQNGGNYPNRIDYTEVETPERLAYHHSREGKVNPFQFNVEVTFEAQGDVTQIAMRLQFDSAEACRRIVQEYGAIEGGTQTLERLEKHVATIATGTADERMS